MKSAILFSGGWDSAAVYFKLQYYSEAGCDWDLVFFNYGQKYYEQEHAVVNAFSKGRFNRVFVIDHKLGHDADRRNFLLLAQCKRQGWDRVAVGSRNLFPWFDRYKDSNWYSLKQFGKLMNMQILTPITGWSKSTVFNFVQEHTNLEFYNCYFGNYDWQHCSCMNCAEMRRVRA